MSDGTRANWAERLVERIRRMPLLVLVLFASVLVSSVVVLVTAGFHVARWYSHRFDWRTREYTRLTSLKAGYTLAKFRATLGPPLFQRKLSRVVPQPFSERARWQRVLVESSFGGRDYWVQTVSDPSGTVLSYAVTACGTDFTPTFRGPYGSFRVTLNRSTFDRVVPWHTAGELKSIYFPSGATANSFFYDVMYGGNPLDYKSFAWGLDDACPDWFPFYEGLYKKGLIPFGKAWSYSGPTKHGGSQVRRFRSSVVINTYAETAPAEFKIDLATAWFQIGVDRILVRPIADQAPPK